MLLGLPNLVRVVMGASAERNRRDAAADQDQGHQMTQNRRKLLGLFAILGSLVVHAIIFSAIYANWMAGLPRWALIIYFAIAGMLWIFPAGYLIKWMSRPDEE